ncbi:MAG: DNA polymerase III subunit delta [Ilumatobacteraceae bacterium]|jgi:DNA polymerase-3 subunit delta|nr:DNA polymerase III subunit delta [Ilumatobacteraceae bacterium]
MSVELLTGDDESILRAAVHDRVRQLVGDGDRTLMVDDFDGEEFELRAAVDAAQTPPFLTDHRVVVVRGVGRFTADELAPLLRYLDDPLPSTRLLLVGGGGRIVKALTDAVKAAGGIATSTSPPARPKERAAWVAEQAEEHGLRLEPAAAARAAAWLGDDVGRLDGILSTLVATYGPGHRLGTADIEPFLGEAGGVPPWDFTDAIDTGDAARALSMLQRMVDAGERHPLQVMAILHGHYAKLARLDGVGATSEADAAAAMGIKPGFPAKKALTTYGRLGAGGVQRAVQLLAAADLDLRGASDLEDRVVMEVLVARLARLTPARVSPRR